MATEPLDAAALDRLAALESAATPGPWDTDECPHSTKGWLIFGPDGDGLVTCHGNPGYGYTGGPPGGDPETDARALVWLRNHARQLIDLARVGLAAEAELGRLCRILDTLEGAVDAALEAAAVARKRAPDGE